MKQLTALENKFKIHQEVCYFNYCESIHPSKRKVVVGIVKEIRAFDDDERILYSVDARCGKKWLLEDTLFENIEELKKYYHGAIDALISVEK